MVIITEVIQNSDAWRQLRLGIPTASCFEKIVKTNGQRSASREKYLFKLAGEKLSGEKTDSYYGASMAKGHEREDESRTWYSFMNDIEVKQVGFCFFDDKKEFGGSPDGLVGEDGGFETKNAESHVQVDRLVNGWSKAKHFQQVQGSLYITGRKWWDLVSFSRGIKPIVIRFHRDEKFIAKLAEEIQAFIQDLGALVAKLKA